MKRLLCVVTGGQGDLRRARRLTEGLSGEIEFCTINKDISRRRSTRQVWNRLRERHWDLVYLEGTGIAGGMPLIWAAQRWKQPFIVSSGDPIGGFFHVTKGPIVGGLFDIYERALYRSCAGFLGWTPYLTGLALSLGAPRGATVEGGVDLDAFRPAGLAERRRLKICFGMNPDHLICGVIGSLRWTPRQSYCYGLELIEMLKYLKRDDVSVLIVGDGNGRARLEQIVSPSLKARVVFAGQLSSQDVVKAINVMDVGFITQTMDGLGNYRLTTKLPEYLACGVPVAMSPIPGFYDYAAPGGWSLPATHPASPAFHHRCAEWLDILSRDEVTEKAEHARELACSRFDYEELSSKFQRFTRNWLE